MERLVELTNLSGISDSVSLDTISIKSGKGEIGYADLLRTTMSDTDMSEFGEFGESSELETKAIIEKISIVEKGGVQNRQMSTHGSKMLKILENELKSTSIMSAEGTFTVRENHTRKIYDIEFTDINNKKYNIEIPRFMGDYKAKHALDKVSRTSSSPVDFDSFAESFIKRGSGNMFINKSGEKIWPSLAKSGSTLETAGDAFVGNFKKYVTRITKALQQDSTSGSIQNKVTKLNTEMMSSVVPTNKPEWNATFESFIRFGGLMHDKDFDIKRKIMEGNHSSAVQEMLISAAGRPSSSARESMSQMLEGKKDLLDDIVNTINWGGADNFEDGEYIRRLRRGVSATTGGLQKLESKLRPLVDTNIMSASQYKIITNLVSASTYVKGSFNLYKYKHADQNARTSAASLDRGLSLMGIPMEEIYPALSNHYTNTYGYDLNEITKAEPYFQDMFKRELNAKEKHSSLLDSSSRKMYRFQLANTGLTASDAGVYIGRQNNGLIFSGERKRGRVGFGGLIDDIGPKQFLAGAAREYDHMFELNTKNEVSVWAEGTGSGAITPTVKSYSDKSLLSINRQIMEKAAAGANDPDANRLILTLNEIKMLGITSPGFQEELHDGQGRYHVLFTKTHSDVNGATRIRVITPRNTAHAALGNKGSMKNVFTHIQLTGVSSALREEYNDEFGGALVKMAKDGTEIQLGTEFYHKRKEFSKLTFGGLYQVMENVIYGRLMKLDDHRKGVLGINTTSSMATHEMKTGIISGENNKIIQMADQLITEILFGGIDNVPDEFKKGVGKKVRWVEHITLPMKYGEGNLGIVLKGGKVLDQITNIKPQTATGELRMLNGILGNKGQNINETVQKVLKDTFGPEIDADMTLKYGENWANYTMNASASLINSDPGGFGDKHGHGKREFWEHFKPVVIHSSHAADAKLSFNLIMSQSMIQGGTHRREEANGRVGKHGFGGAKIGFSEVMQMYRSNSTYANWIGDLIRNNVGRTAMPHIMADELNRMNASRGKMNSVFLEQAEKVATKDTGLLFKGINEMSWYEEFHDMDNKGTTEKYVKRRSFKSAVSNAQDNILSRMREYKNMNITDDVAKHVNAEIQGLLFKETSFFDASQLNGMMGLFNNLQQVHYKNFDAGHGVYGLKLPTEFRVPTLRGEGLLGDNPKTNVLYFTGLQNYEFPGQGSYSDVTNTAASKKVDLVLNSNKANK